MQLKRSLGKKERISYSVIFPVIVFVIASVISKNELLNLALTLLLVPIFLILKLNEKVFIVLALLGLGLVTVLNWEKYQSYIVIESYWQLLAGTIIFFINTISLKKNKISDNNSIV